MCVGGGAHVWPLEDVTLPAFWEMGAGGEAVHLCEITQKPGGVEKRAQVLSQAVSLGQGSGRGPVGGAGSGSLRGCSQDGGRGCRPLKAQLGL